MIDTWMNNNQANNPVAFFIWSAIIVMIVTEINYIIFLYIEKGYKKKIKEPWLNLKVLAIFFAIVELTILVLLIMAFQYFQITLSIVSIFIIIAIWLWLNKQLAEIIWKKH